MESRLIENFDSPLYQIGFSHLKLSISILLQEISTQHLKLYFFCVLNEVMEHQRVKLPGIEAIPKWYLDSFLFTRIKFVVSFHALHCWLDMR